MVMLDMAVMNAPRRKMLKVPDWIVNVDIADPVYGTMLPLGEGGVTVVPFAEELLPTTGTLILNFEHTSPNNVVKASQPCQFQSQLSTQLECSLYKLALGFPHSLSAHAEMFEMIPVCRTQWQY